MAKPSAAIHTPRPSALRSSSSSTFSCSATRSSVGSTSSSAVAAASKLPVAAATHRDSASNSKVVAKCLVYDDDYFTLPSAAAPSPHPDDLAPLLEIPADPDVVSGDTSSTSVASAAADDALTASADSCVTEVPAREDCSTDTEAALPEEISHALTELRGACGLSQRSKRLLAALAEAAALQLAPAAATTTTRRACFWGKVRVAVLAATLAAVAAADVALAAAPTSGTATPCCPPPDGDRGLSLRHDAAAASCCSTSFVASRRARVACLCLQSV